MGCVPSPVQRPIFSAEATAARGGRHIPVQILQSMSVGYQSQGPRRCRPPLLSMRRLAAGRVIKDFPRDRIKITSKWGPIFGAEGHSSDMRPAHARASCEASLKRLGTDYLDMMIFRGPARDPHGTPIEDCIKGMAVWTNVLVPLH